MAGQAALIRRAHLEMAATQFRDKRLPVDSEDRADKAEAHQAGGRAADSAEAGAAVVAHAGEALKGRRELPRYGARSA